MNALDQEIQTAFQATSLILVFVTVLFGLRYPQIQRDIGKETPVGEKAKARLREDLWKSLLVNCTPLLVINGAASYLFSPLLVRVVRGSRFEVWSFDFSRTSFVFIALLVLVFFLWSCYLAAQLVRGIMKCA